MFETERAEFHRIDPGHERADQNAERDAEKGEHAGGERARETPEQVVEFPDRRGAHDGAVAGLVVAHDDIGDERRQR